MSLGIILFIGFVTSVYLAFAKTPPLISGGKGVYRFPNRRLWALGFVVIIPITIITLLLVKPTWTFIYITLKYPDPEKVLHDFTYSEGPIKFEQLLMSDSGTDYRIEATLKNPQSDDLLINKIIFLFYRDNPNISCLSSVIRLKISDQLTVAQSNQDGSTGFGGSFLNMEEPEFSYPFKGEFGAYCDNLGLNFELETSIILPGNEYSRIYILLPRSLKVVNDNSSYIDNNKHQLITSYTSVSLAEYSQIKVYVSIAATEEKLVYAVINKYIDTWTPLINGEERNGIP